MFVYRKADTDLDARVTTIPIPSIAAAKAPFLPRKRVMRFFQAVETHANIRKTYLLEFGRDLFGNERAVCGNDRPHVFIFCILRQFQ